MEDSAFTESSFLPALVVRGAPKGGFRPAFGPVVKVTIYESFGLALGSATHIYYILRIHHTSLSLLSCLKYRHLFHFIYIDAPPSFLLTGFFEIPNFSQQRRTAPCRMCPSTVESAWWRGRSPLPRRLTGDVSCSTTIPNHARPGRQTRQPRRPEPGRRRLR